ncbi:MAG TPA: hypothetical protein VK348_10670, partial [Planctomycetota bacterium]|nr:hypothetical protein [Planctomycetota bacterium]
SLAFDSGRGRIVMFGGGVQDTWELLPPTTPTWTRHGLGCSSSAGTPALDRAPGALPALGTTFPLQFTALPAQPGALLLAFGFGIARWNGNALPIDLGATGLPGCKLWIEPGAGIVIGHGGGSGSFPLAIPNHAALAGVLIAAQALVFDPAAGNGIGVVTNAGVMRLN